MGVDGGVLPDGPLGAGKAADEEAAHLHQLAGARYLDVAHGLRRPGRLGRGGMAGHQGKALGPRAEAMAAQHPPDPVGREPDPYPLLAPQLGGDARRAVARVGKREGQHPLLDHRAGLVGHRRRPALAGAQQLQAVAIGHLLPAVEGRVMDPQGATGGAHVAELSGQGEGTQAVAIQDIIWAHGGGSLVRLADLHPGMLAAVACRRIRRRDRCTGPAGPPASLARLLGERRASPSSQILPSVASTRR